MLPKKLSPIENGQEQGIREFNKDSGDSVAL